jgi:predicted nucleic acid-binding protein
MKAVIDSDVLIDFLQGFEKARLELARYRSPLYSVISWMEVMCGAESKEEREAAESLFASMQRVDLTGKVAAQAVRERCQRGLKLPDAMILATAEVEGCMLVTRNTKDFDGDDPRVRFPYSI